MPKLVFSPGCAVALFATMAACSSKTPDWNRHGLVAAQPTVGQPAPDPIQPPPLPGCPCEASMELVVTVTDSAGDPVSGVTFPGHPTAVCVGWGSRGVPPDAGALDAADAGAQDGGADGDAPDAGEAEGGGAHDAAGEDAAEAGAGACSTWRFSIMPPTYAIQVAAPGYQWGGLEFTWPSTCCAVIDPVVDRSVVLRPLPSCPDNWGPCSRDAGLRGSPTSCVCP